MGRQLSLSHTAPQGGGDTNKIVLRYQPEKQGVFSGSRFYLPFFIRSDNPANGLWVSSSGVSSATKLP